jgi:O-antigen/teichoic acid export membrane protein
MALLKLPRLVSQYIAPTMLFDIGAVALGSLLSQLITLSASPVLTRLYGPTDFAVFALFTAFVTTVVPAASGRFDLASVVTPNREDVRGLLVVALLMIAATVFVLALAQFLGGGWLIALLGMGALAEWWLFLPVVVGICAVGVAFQYAANRRANYRLIAFATIAQSAANVCLSIVFGLSGVTGDGLLVGFLGGAVVFASVLVVGCGLPPSASTSGGIKRLWNLAKDYSRYPAFDASTAILNSAKFALPVLFLSKNYPLEVAGYYALISRVAVAPFSFLYNAVFQVNLRQSAEILSSNGDLLGYLRNLIAVLFLVVAIPCAVLAVVSPWLFEHVFGKEWRAAGELLRFLVPAIVIQFVASAVSGTIVAAGRVGLGGAWRVFAFLITLGGLGAFAGKCDVEGVFILIAVLDVVTYAAYLVISIYAAYSAKRQHLPSC